MGGAGDNVVNATAFARQGLQQELRERAVNQRPDAPIDSVIELHQRRAAGKGTNKSSCVAILCVKTAGEQ